MAFSSGEVSKMRVVLISVMVLILTSAASAGEPGWSIFEKETPNAAWTDLEYPHLPSKKWAFDSAESRCLASRSKALKPKAQLKIVAPDGTEHILVCSEVRAANGTPDTETVVKEGQIKLW